MAPANINSTSFGHCMLVLVAFICNMPFNVTAQTLTFERDIYDFGKVELHADSEKLLHFRNTGSDTLVFTSFPKTACGCDMAYLSGYKTSYAPNEEGDLVYKFITSYPHVYNNVIRLRTNSEQEETIIRVRWEVYDLAGKQPD
jgi:hypothetical protein